MKLCLLYRTVVPVFKLRTLTDTSQAVLAFLISVRTIVDSEEIFLSHSEKN